VTLNYHWISGLPRGHILGLCIALLLVSAMAALLFRSATAGLLTLVPVLRSVLAGYAAMVLLGIPLEVGTSMFAAVAIGLGVDFAIHALAKIRSACADTQGNLLPALLLVLRPTFLSATIPAEHRAP
jgi:predicted RND superfamily exporter protein